MTSNTLRVVREQVTLVDSCVLLDVATDDPKWGAWSAEALSRVLDEGRLIVNPVVYSEVSVGYESIESLDEALPPEDYEREDVPFEAAFLAGKAFLAYRRRGGGKRSPLPDFFIGAHAAVRKYRLLTRDTARYRTYFPTVELIAP
ncbi:type II toxin-antitoxin system VapC family toxin [Microbispora sp. NPDC049633]|uniref:type II toxin-antitoxin system VapC family toxin n=1 Tax=Microbispora sp. NPDC049633 TaxID=3154355 RepID=UPI00343D0A8E